MSITCNLYVIQDYQDSPDLRVSAFALSVLRSESGESRSVFESTGPLKTHVRKLGPVSTAGLLPIGRRMASRPTPVFITFGGSQAIGLA
jgi:hypothetical protein